MPSLVGSEMCIRDRYRFLGVVESVDERRLRGEMLDAAQPAEEEEEPHEDDVDDGDDRLEEVVVVRRDELAELVDEEAEADAPRERAQDVPQPSLQGQEQDDGDEHAEAAPEQVGEVDLAA